MAIKRVAGTINVSKSSQTTGPVINPGRYALTSVLVRSINEDISILRASTEHLGVRMSVNGNKLLGGDVRRSPSSTVKTTVEPVWRPVGRFGAGVTASTTVIEYSIAVSRASFAAMTGHVCTHV